MPTFPLKPSDDGARSAAAGSPNRLGWRVSLSRIVGVSTLTVALNACSAPACDEIVVGKASEGLVVTVGASPVKTLEPAFFGFNLENTEFQLSLWDPKGVRSARRPSRC